MKLCDDDLQRLAVVVHASQQDLEEDLSEIKTSRIGTAALDFELHEMCTLLKIIHKEIDRRNKNALS